MRNKQTYWIGNIAVVRLSHRHHYFFGNDIGDPNKGFNWQVVFRGLAKRVSSLAAARQWVKTELPKLQVFH